MKRPSMFRKMRGVPDRVLGNALSNHQQNLQALVLATNQQRHGIIVVGRLAFVAIGLAVVALAMASYAIFQ